jgi:AraC-like DNA-binding protein
VSDDPVDFLLAGRLSLLFGQLGQAVAQDRGALSRAAELHLASGYLVRLFNAATGLPPMAYLAQLRAEHAAVLLLHTGESVTSIGRTVGWPDQSMLRAG